MSIENCTSKYRLVDIDNVDESNRGGKFYLFWTYTTDGDVRRLLLSLKY